jgi:hypothetical protein
MSAKFGVSSHPKKPASGVRRRKRLQFGFAQQYDVGIGQPRWHDFHELAPNASCGAKLLGQGLIGVRQTDSDRPMPIVPAGMVEGRERQRSDLTRLAVIEPAHPGVKQLPIGGGKLVLKRGPAFVKDRVSTVNRAIGLSADEPPGKAWSHALARAASSK